MQYKRTVLPNGLRMITVPMPSFETATVLVMVGAGSRYETKLNNGISHFLEHMAFKGTQKRPNAMAISSLIDGIGGEFNAFTSKEYTGYYIKAQSNHIELSLDLLSDMLNNSVFDEKEIEKEKGVIIEEINMYEDTPMRNLGDVYERVLYDDTPMGWDTAGTKDVISKVTRNDFVEYMKSLYSADNMTVIVAGGLDSTKVEDMVKKYFGGMPQFPILKALPVTEDQNEPNSYVKEKTTEQVHLAIGVRTVPLGHPDEDALEVLANILGGGMSSRLFSEVREKRGLAYYVRMSSDNYTDCGTLVATAGVDPKRAQDAVRVILEELGRIKEPGNVTEEELKRAKEYINGHFVMDLEDSRSVAIYFAHQEILENRIYTPVENIEKINKVSLADIERVAQKYLAEKTLNFAVIGKFDTQNVENLLKLA